MTEIPEATSPSSSSSTLSLSLPIRLPSALLQTCASFLAFRQQRRLVATCVALARCIDHPLSVAYAFESDYPTLAAEAAAGDAMMARLVRNRMPRLAFRHDRAGIHQALTSQHLVLLSDTMHQLTSLSVTVGAFVSASQLARVASLPLLAHLDLTFEDAPSLGALIDDFRVAPCAENLVLRWREACNHWAEILTVGMLVSAASSSSPPASLAPSPTIASSPTTMWRPDPTCERQHARVVEWLGAYKPPNGFTHGRKAWSTLSALAEISAACPALDFGTVLAAMPLAVKATRRRVAKYRACVDSLL